MSNIMYDEKRFLNIGEVCAIHLKNIKPIIHFGILEDKTKVFFGSDYFGNGVSQDDDITFIKYLGNGLFMDLVSEQLFLTEMMDKENIGTKEYISLDDQSKAEIEKMDKNYITIGYPENINKFEESFSAFTENPLIINYDEAPFISINAEIVKKFVSQSLNQTKTKLLMAKLKAQQQLIQQYNEKKEEIVEFYQEKELSSYKTM